MSMQRKQILSDIEKAYGDLRNPNFNFIMNSYNSLKYKDVLREIHDSFTVIDHTDLNYDTCISLEITYRKKTICLYLSLVSPYAFLFYEGKVISCRDDLYPAFFSVVDILSSYAFYLLNKDELLYDFDIDISSFDVEDKKASILGLLFSFGLSIS